MKKIAIVTGGTRGIGLGIFKQLYIDGFTVCVMGTRVEDSYEEFHKFTEDNGIDYLYFQGDISSSDSRQEFIDEIMKKYGRIDLLVNNAGVAPNIRQDMLELTENSMDRLYDINTKGTFYMTQLVAKEMIKQKIVDGVKGIIINIGSMSATVSSINRADYCISKASISMMTKLFADRLSNDRIFVYEIRPGIIESDMTSTVKDKYDKLFEDGICLINRWGTPKDIGDAVSLLAEGRLRYTTGQVLNLDGGFTIQRL